MDLKFDGGRIVFGHKPALGQGFRIWEVNVDGSRIAAECAVEAGVGAFIHMSSSALYGEQLGLRLALDKEFPERGMRLLFFRIAGVTVELERAPVGARTRGSAG